MGPHKFKKIMKIVEDALTAATFAEEGESAAARSLLKASRKVLLALEAEHINPKTLKYAQNTAARVNASLDILLVGTTGKETDRILGPFFLDLDAAGIPHKLLHGSGCLKKEIIDYTNREKEVLFAVIESPESLDAECRSGDEALSNLWRSLSCPLVVVTDPARA